MNRIMKLMLITLILGISACSSMAQKSSKMDHSGIKQIKKGVFTAQKEIEWMQPFGKDAPVYFGAVYGKTFKTPHGTFGKFPVGFTSPTHTHSNSYHAVVISGTITNPMKGDTEKPKNLGPGSYWFVPANSVHETSCVSKEPCLFYMYQTTSFDFKPVQK